MSEKSKQLPIFPKMLHDCTKKNIEPNISLMNGASSGNRCTNKLIHVCSRRYKCVVITTVN